MCFWMIFTLKCLTCHQLNARRYPTWASLARDYLAIMASSVSSERAFSAAGITISKRRNRLKGDIVEALQVLKLMIHNELLFREAPVSTELEEDMDAADIIDEDEDAAETVAKGNEFSWDQLIEDDCDYN